MKLSNFGRRFTARTGTLSLMDDLGRIAASGRELVPLGGGNPSHIPEMESVFRARLLALAQETGRFERVAGDYDGPRGDPRFLEAVAGCLNRVCGWPVGPENVIVTNGSQGAFFGLFNMLAGSSDEGERRRILFPLTPEYIGYADLGLEPGIFVSRRPGIEHLDGGYFKYRVDFDALEIGPDIGAICVSRPTNPTGNVIDAGELERLRARAREHDIPLVLDNAYGLPFPGIVFGDETAPAWGPETVMLMSLSKVGLPGLRTGIVVAREEIIDALAALNALFSLAPGSFGPALVTELFENDEIIRLSREVIRPHYQARASEAAARLLERLAGYDVHVHRPEGAIFLWLWCRNLPVPNSELYERLKARGVIVVSGHHFFPGLQEPWQHTRECLRITYAHDMATVRRGLDIIAEEVARAYDEGRSGDRGGSGGPGS